MCVKLVLGLKKFFLNVFSHHKIRNRIRDQKSLFCSLTEINSYIFFQKACFLLASFRHSSASHKSKSKNEFIHFISVSSNSIRKFFFQNFFIIKGIFYPINFLVFFMAFSRYQNDVFGIGQTHCSFDRLPSIAND